MSSARVFEIEYGMMHTGMAAHTNIIDIKCISICQVSLCFLRQFLSSAQFDCFRFPKLINTVLEGSLIFFNINIGGMRA